MSSVRCTWTSSAVCVHACNRCARIPVRHMCARAVFHGRHVCAHTGFCRCHVCTGFHGHHGVRVRSYLESVDHGLLRIHRLRLLRDEPPRQHPRVKLKSKAHSVTHVVICAGYRSSAKHNRHPESFPVYSTFSMKMVFNSIHIWFRFFLCVG